MTDVALDPYNCDGHDGIVSSAGVILNDETIEVLCAQAACHARAGADIVAPSDMMDGRVGAIRTQLDAEGYTDVSIMAYTAKYASAFYGPFRGALDSAPKASGSSRSPLTSLTCQMDPANVREALRELELDRRRRRGHRHGQTRRPVSRRRSAFCVTRQRCRSRPYPVSGEYLMIKSAAQAGWLDERAVVLETLLGIRRAGADIILTYFAPQVAEWLNG